MYFVNEHSSNHLVTWLERLAVSTCAAWNAFILSEEQDEGKALNS